MKHVSDLYIEYSMRKKIIPTILLLYSQNLTLKYLKQVITYILFLEAMNGIEKINVVILK